MKPMGDPRCVQCLLQQSHRDVEGNWTHPSEDILEFYTKKELQTVKMIGIVMKIVNPDRSATEAMITVPVDWGAQITMEEHRKEIAQHDERGMTSETVKFIHLKDT